VNDEATARSSADTAISAQIGTVAASIDGRNRTFLQSSTPTATLRATSGSTPATATR
jgi:hypothetical protein